MSRSKLEDAKRKKVWDSTKEAVRHYARNPCRATEIEVKSALGEVRRLPLPCQPRPKRAQAKDRKG
ncbi:MAG: hypothetical protein OEM59_10670 [Rhodospirillales bacterium]|nr:hypothetical protein [Rhodospirillales bacterium]